MKYTTVKISEIAAHPTMRLDPGYWLNKKKLRPKRKRARAQAAKKDLTGPVNYEMIPYNLNNLKRRIKLWII